MTLVSKSTIFSFCVLFITLSAAATCSYPELQNQQRDNETIRRLETSWSLAYLRGDAEFERCLLTNDFTEIMKDGKIQSLADELALAEKNKGNAIAPRHFPPVTVHIHGNAAVSYGLNTRTPHGRKSPHFYFADYYVWQSGSWHAYFAQQTAFE